MLSSVNHQLSDNILNLCDVANRRYNEKGLYYFSLYFKIQKGIYTCFIITRLQTKMTAPNLCAEEIITQQKWSNKKAILSINLVGHPWTVL